MSWLSDIPLALIVPSRPSRPADPFLAWIADPRDLTFGEFLLWIRDVWGWEA